MRACAIAQPVEYQRSPKNGSQSRDELLIPYAIAPSSALTRSLYIRSGSHEHPEGSEVLMAGSEITVACLLPGVQILKRVISNS